MISGSHKIVMTKLLAYYNEGLRDSAFGTDNWTLWSRDKEFEEHLGVDAARTVDLIFYM